MNLAIKRIVKGYSRKEVLSIIPIDKDQYDRLIEMIKAGEVKYKYKGLSHYVTLVVKIPLEDRMLFHKKHPLHFPTTESLFSKLPSFYSNIGGDDETIGEYKKRMDEEKNS
jgi:hypothetical protein